MLVLGAVPFQDFALPEEIAFGGEQALARHRLIGGKKVFDALGPDDAPIAWKGLFRGPLATLQARQLDGMRRAGKIHVLTWGTFAYKVVIRRFEATYHHANRVSYGITCEVIEDMVAARLGAFLTRIEDAVTGGIADAFGLSADNPILTGAVASVQAAVVGVSTGGFNLQTLSGAATAGLQATVGGAAATAGASATGAMASLGGAALSTALSGPATGIAANLTGLVGAAETAWRSEGVRNLLTRVGDNLGRAA